LIEQDAKTLQLLLPEIPTWIKNPDYDRVRYSLQLYDLCKSVYLGNQKGIVGSTAN